MGDEGAVMRAGKVPLREKEDEEEQPTKLKISMHILLLRQLERWAVSLVPSSIGSSSGCKLSTNHKFLGHFSYNLLIPSPRIIKCNDTLIDAT